MRFLSLVVSSYLAVSSVHALELTIASGEAEKSPYSLLSIHDSTPLSCTQMSTTHITCTTQTTKLSRQDPIVTKFFSVIPKLTAKGIVLDITTSGKAKLFSPDLNTSSEHPIDPRLPLWARYWQIVAHEASKIPFVTPTSPTSTSLIFPVTLPSVPDAYVGPLDVSGRPIPDTNDYRDIRTFFEAKKLIETHDDTKALQLIDKTLEKNPKTLFAGEYGFLKLKALSRLGQPTHLKKLVETGEQWLKRFPIDDNAAEVLLMMGDAQGNLGENKEANYYYDRLMSDFPESKFSTLAMIHQGDTFKPIKMANKAIELYAKALHTTKDKEIATLAASKLAKKYIELDQPTQAISYYQKIFDGNPNFFLSNPAETLKTIDYLSKNGSPKLALSIAELLFKNSDPKADFRPDLVLILGDLYDHAHDTKNGQKAYTYFVEKFPKRPEFPEIKKRLTKLALNDDNISDPIAHYDTILKTAKGDIASLALYKKAKYLFDQKRYHDFLALKQSFSKLPDDIAPQKQTMIIEASRQLALQKLESKECPQAIELIMSEKITLPASHQLPLFGCLVTTNRFDLAKKVSLQAITKAAPEGKLAWMLRHAEILKKEKNSKEILALSKDIVTLADTFKTNPLPVDPYKILYDRFAAANTLDDYQAAISTTHMLAARYPEDPANIDVYRKSFTLATKHKDQLMAEKMTQRLFDLQNRLHIMTYSPWIEFVYSDHLIEHMQIPQAIKVVQQAFQRSQQPSDKAHALYLLAQVYQKQNNLVQARQSLQQCTKLQGKSSWHSMCQDALSLYR